MIDWLNQPVWLGNNVFSRIDALMMAAVATGFAVMLVVGLMAGLVSLFIKLYRKR